MAELSLSVLHSFKTTECCSCGVVIALPAEFHFNRRRDHKLFYCPSGHGQHFTGETEEEKLKKKLAEREAELARARAAAETKDRANAALRGQITKTKRRVAAGVCPCCNRSFVALGRHMTTKHPDWKEQDIG